MKPSKSRASEIHTALHIRVSFRLGACEVRLTMPISIKSATRTMAKKSIHTSNGYSIAFITSGIPVVSVRLERQFDGTDDAAQAIGIDLRKIVGSVAVDIENRKNLGGSSKNRNDYLGACRRAAGNMAGKIINISDDHGLFCRKGMAANALVETDPS